MPVPVAADPEHPAASLAETVASAVQACPGVVDLYGGGLAPVATYLPGRRVTGVSLDEHRVRVSIIVARGIPVVQVAGAIRAALADLAGGRPVDVHVADVQEPPPALPA